MNRKFTTIFAIVCILAALGAIGSVAYRVISTNAAGRDSARADFEGLLSALAYVKGPADIADPGLRARLASRYEASQGLLLVDVYERGGGDRWRIPADSPYLSLDRRGVGAPEPAYPPFSTILLSSPLKGDSSGRLAVDALYTSLPQIAIFEAFRDALIGLGAFLALAVFILAIVSGREKKDEEAGDGDEASPSATATELATEAAHYQYETLNAEAPIEEPAPEPALAPVPRQEAPHRAKAGGESLGGFMAMDESELPEEEEFDIPIMSSMDSGLSVKTAPADLPLEPPAEEKPREGPSGLYSPASGLGWESYMRERLDAELSRSASFEQDLSLLALCYDGLSSSDPEYLKIVAAIKEIFSFRDLAFERGDEGFSIILPNIDSAHALRMADELNRKLVFLADGDFSELELLPLYMGISSRSGRLVDAERLAGEASAALERARYEKDTHIVAFKPDPDKYRLFLATKGA
jgi:hypothetical protein